VRGITSARTHFRRNCVEIVTEIHTSEKSTE
jgi:hypothetical protein